MGKMKRTKVRLLRVLHVYAVNFFSLIIIDVPLSLGYKPGGGLPLT